VVGRRRLGRVEKKNQVKKERKKVRLTKVGGERKKKKNPIGLSQGQKRRWPSILFFEKKKENFYLPV
jgi:ABC-type lipoprotein export system ATPase subunit